MEQTFKATITTTSRCRLLIPEYVKKLAVMIQTVQHGHMPTHNHLLPKATLVSLVTVKKEMFAVG
jgi:hypothetical protein